MAETIVNIQTKAQPHTSDHATRFFYMETAHDASRRDEAEMKRDEKKWEFSASQCFKASSQPNWFMLLRQKPERI